MVGGLGSVIWYGAVRLRDLDPGVTVVCVLRSGKDFKPAHVRQLYDGLVRWWPFRTMPFRFEVLSDVREADNDVPLVTPIPLKHNWPGWWSKLELFRPDLDYLGDILYFDLDTVVVGDLTDIVLVNQLTMLDDFYNPGMLGSGLMYLPMDVRHVVWDKWIRDPRTPMMRVRGDQEFIGGAFGYDRPRRWQRLLPGQVISYKADIREPKEKTMPQDARVVCFHGRPRPWQVTLPRGGGQHEAHTQRPSRRSACKTSAVKGSGCLRETQD
ncbi:hypothetical protein LCGC14_0709820 [marine sediment metagenome]|uniref:Nucleotide-diphospho-sugar transferase domain-containing protein n=1 Tax=marine sediment metagenome TaxID=412755 RepID=A0A0F9R0W4_9ZZZZ